MERTIVLNALNIDPCVFFHGTDEEIQAAEEKEAARAAEIEAIIFSESFRAMEYINYYGQRRILHHSTRPGISFQLSYIDPDGVPAMHENFIKSGETAEPVSIKDKKHLLRHYVNKTLSESLTLTVLTD